ncbi:hypothetical protein ONS95_002819 [Cadophora gregata]|uniref:uncharacterized protein n=1 Tax=Cadophora gregata TaxID=51156 RepID=UPI0026DC48EB|nr:uncharacterized protein ONS95_002819 [Cadophora gregata]KAK0110168.1 hypothetical protein ONS95_002819 [Cadophora gregata]KAK0110217.1 hypothetical protein ONS96_001840 [Cadophora gregata f. sp. sojae]
MPSPDEIFANWRGVIDNDFSKTIIHTFNLPDQDDYVYRAEGFAMTLRQIQDQIDSGKLKYKYQSHGQQIEVPPTDITAYTTLFSPTISHPKALTSLLSNAKKGSPRATVAQYLLHSHQRICPFQIPKSKTHINPYYDLWALSCQETAFLGPLPDPSYASPANAKHTHPILPVFYHHFGCVVPSYEALYIISQLARESAAEGVIDMGSGNGYWTYMLRRMNLALTVTAVDNMESEYRTMWIDDTIHTDGVEYLRQNDGGKGRVLLLVYMVTKGRFTERVVRAYRGDTIVLVGTRNANRFTGFGDCTAEEFFEREEMAGWELSCKVAVPSFAGKDEGLLVWRRRREV